MAILDYSCLASFKLEEDKEYIEVKMKEINPQVRKILADEFANYALVMTKKCS